MFVLLAIVSHPSLTEVWKIVSKGNSYLTISTTLLITGLSTFNLSLKEKFLDILSFHITANLNLISIFFHIFPLDCHLYYKTYIHFYMHTCVCHPVLKLPIYLILMTIFSLYKISTGMVWEWHGLDLGNMSFYHMKNKYVKQ